MNDLTPQMQGRAWEREFAKSIGAEPVKMSGAGFAKLDVRGSSILWSLKWSANHRSVRIEDAWMHEAIAAIRGPGGIGGSMVPAIATKTHGFELVTFRKVDAIMLMSSDTHDVASPASYDAVDRSRRVPEFLRHTGES